MLFVQPTCGSIFRLTTSMNMLEWRVKTELHRPTSRINRLIIGKQTIVKLSTIVSIASATIVIVKKHYRSALVMSTYVEWLCFHVTSTYKGQCACTYTYIASWETNVSLTSHTHLCVCLVSVTHGDTHWSLHMHMIGLESSSLLFFCPGHVIKTRQGSQRVSWEQWSSRPVGAV